MTEPLGFVYLVRDLMRAAGVRCAITSGMACVYYGLQQTTKDTDWIVDPADLAKLRDLLFAQQRRLPPWQISYRTIFGAPMDARWMQHGWTCHIRLQNEAHAAEHHLDFFARPPRVAAWSQTEDGFAERNVVAMMKKTDRERDWPFVDSLGWQMLSAGSDNFLGLLHVQDAERVRYLWTRASATERETAAARRPLLRRIDTEPTSDRLERWIRLERLVWQCVNRERYGRYQQAWKDFYRRWRQEADWSWPTAEPFMSQHQRLLDAASRHGLVMNPLADLDSARLREAGIEKAAAVSFASVEQVRSVAPGPTEVLL